MKEPWSENCGAWQAETVCQVEKGVVKITIKDPHLGNSRWECKLPAFKFYATRID